MAKTVAKAREEHQPQKTPDQRVNIYPKCLSLLWPRIVQKSQHTDNDDEHEHGPMKCDGAETIVPRRLRRTRRFQGICAHNFIASSEMKIKLGGS